MNFIWFQDNNQLYVPDDVDANKGDDISDVDVNTPTQPPPTPEVLTPKEPPSPKTKTCITKKTLDKKPVNRHKKKEEMEKPVEEPVKQPTPPPSPPPPPVIEEK